MNPQPEQPQQPQQPEAAAPAQPATVITPQAVVMPETAPAAQPAPAPLAASPITEPSPAAPITAAAPAVQPTMAEQPAAVPVAPVAPAQPVAPAAPASTPTAPVAAPAPAPVQPVAAAQGSGKGMKTGLIIAAVAVLALLIIGGGVLAALSLGGVSKKDYAAAETTLQTANDAYNKLASTYVSISTTPTEAKNDLDTITKSRSAFDTSFKQLGSDKAITKNSDLKKLYAQAAAKKSKFDQSVAATSEVYAKIIPAISALDSDVSSNTSSATIGSLQKAFSGISGLQNQYNKDFVAAASTALQQMQAAYVRVEAGRADYKKYDSKAYTDFTTAYDSYDNAAKDWQSNLQKLADDGDISKPLYALQLQLIKKG